jgi:hypothetical protein
MGWDWDRLFDRQRKNRDIEEGTLLSVEAGGTENIAATGRVRATLVGFDLSERSRPMSRKNIAASCENAPYRQGSGALTVFHRRK